MYDPHRLRSNDRRYFTRKGQIIQAKAITPSFKIEKHKVDAYKRFIIKNHLIPSELPIVIDSLKLEWGNGSSETLRDNEFVYTGDQPQTVNLSPGTRLCFSVSENNEYYNFNIFYSTDTTITFPPNTWGVYTRANDNRCKVVFRSGSRNLFNTELVFDNGYNSYIRVSDIEIIKEIYHIRLPPPDEEEE